MDWLEQHRVVLNCFDKTFTCVNNNEQPIIVKGIPRKTVVRQISALQLKRAVRKGCKAYVVIITDEANKVEKDKIKIENIPVLNEFIDVFSGGNSRITS